MNKLLKFAKSIKDFRLKRKKLHPVENIIFITVVAVMKAKQKERKEQGKKHYSINRMKKILAWNPLALDNIFDF